MAQACATTAFSFGNYGESSNSGECDAKTGVDREETFDESDLAANL